MAGPTLLGAIADFCFKKALYNDDLAHLPPRRTDQPLTLPALKPPVVPGPETEVVHASKGMLTPKRSRG